MDPVSIAEEERLKAIIRAGKLAQMGVKADAPPSITEALAKMDALQAQRTPRSTFDRGHTVLPRGLVMKAPTETDWAVAGAGATNAAAFTAQRGIPRRV